MFKSIIVILSTLINLCAWAGEARTQELQAKDRPTPARPVQPETREALARREAQKLFGLGLLRLREDRLLEAVKLLEEAEKIDPESLVIKKTIIPLYVAMSRTEEALTACRKALDLEPGDHEIWVIQARAFKNQGMVKEARTALSRALKCEGLKDHPETRLQLNFDHAKLCEQLKEYDDAQRSYHEVVTILNSPGSLLTDGTLQPAELKEQAIGTYERMIKLAIEAKQYERAQSAFEDGRKRYPELATKLNYHLAKVHLAQNKPAEALAKLNVYLATQPQGAEAYETWIVALKQLMREAEIMPALRTFSDLDRHNVDLHLLLARQYALHDQPDNARREFLQQAEKYPSPEPYRGLFAMYKNNGQMLDVLKLLDEAVSRSRKNDDSGPADPQWAAKARAMIVVFQEDIPLMRTLVAEAFEGRTGLRLSGQTRLVLAEMARRTRQLDAAELFYRAALETETHPDREYLVYIGLLAVLQQAKKDEAIIEACRAGLKRAQATHFGLFYDYLALSLANLGRTDEAVAAADKGVQISTDDRRLDTQVRRLHVLTLAGRQDEALAEGLKLLKEHPLLGPSRNIRLAVYEVLTAKGEPEKAAEQLQTILKLDPNDALVNNNLGYLWADQGKNLKEAERLIRKAVELDRQQVRSGTLSRLDDGGENAAYLDSLGWILFRRGQVQEAVTWLEKASSLPTGEIDPTVWDHLGDVYFKLGMIAKAGIAWQKARQLFETEKRRKSDDHYKELKNKLRLLEKKRGRESLSADN